MAGCPLDDFELEFLVGRVAERLQQGQTQAQVLAEIGDIGWDEAEVAAFVEEVATRQQELGRAPQGCRLLCQSAQLQARGGLLFATAGAVAAGLSGAFYHAPAVIVVGGALFLYGALLVGRARLRLKRYRD